MDEDMIRQRFVLEELALRTSLDSPVLEPVPLDSKIVDGNGDYSVGFACNLANNAYILCRAIARQGRKARVLYEPDFMDTYPLSSPVWEDREIEAEDESAAAKEIARHGLPELCSRCMYDPSIRSSNPFDVVGVGELCRGTGIKVNSPIKSCKANSVLGHRDMLSQMDAFDVLQVSGNAIGLASVCGKPYVTFPFGGDLYITPFDDNQQGWLQTEGFRRAEMHIATGGAMVDYLERLGVRRSKIAVMPFAYDTDVYAPLRENGLRDDFRRKYPGKTAIFCGSRQNWAWKGNDKFFNALARIKDVRDRVVCISTWWGQDMDKSDALIRQLGLGEVVVKVGLVSKARLRRLVDASDVCVDQFTLGGLGTFALESMSMGKPLLVHYDEKTHFSFSEPPPVFNVSSEDEIFEALQYVLENRDKLPETGSRCREWVVKHHSFKALWPQYDAVYRMAIAQHGARR